MKKVEDWRCVFKNRKSWDSLEAGPLNRSETDG